MAQLAVQPRHQPMTKSDINHNNDIEMWLPNRIFKAFRRQCLQEIAWIESFLNDHALLPPEEITEEAMSVLNIASTKLSHVRQRMATEWHRHLKEVAEGGLEHGQKEPSEELKQLIKNTDQQVNQCLRLSEYFRETNSGCSHHFHAENPNTASIKAITTAPRQDTPIHSGDRADVTKRNSPMAVFTALTEECINVSKNILKSNMDAMLTCHKIDSTTRNNAIRRRDLLMVTLSRMETTYANLMECAQAYDIDEKRDDGIAEIKLMVNRAKTHAMAAKSTTDSLLKVKKKNRDAENNTDAHKVENTERKRPNGKIRYVYAICNDKGGHCADETGRIEADMGDIVLPSNENVWEDMVREAGNAVANEMEKSRHKMQATSLIKLSMKKVPHEERVVKNEKSKPSQEELAKSKLFYPG